MADLDNIEWPSFDSVFRELAPERVEARELRLGIVSDTETQISDTETQISDTETQVSDTVEDPPLRDIPDSTVDDIAAAVMSEISGTAVEQGTEIYDGQDELSDDSIDQLLGNEEFMGHIVDLDSPAPDDFTVSPEEAATANFIASQAHEAPSDEVIELDPTIESASVESEIEYAQNHSVEIVGNDPIAMHPTDPDEPAPVSLFNNAARMPYTESDPEWVWSQSSEELLADGDLGEAPEIDLVELEESVPPPPAPDSKPTSTEDPWADMRPDETEDAKQKKIVFWADRPKFFGGQARHQARAARRLHNKDD